MINEMKSFEPQKVNRFLIEFNSPFDIPTYAVHKMSELKAIHVFGDGWVNWGDLTIEMYETSEIPIASIICKGLAENKSKKTNTISFQLLELNVMGDVIQSWGISAKIKDITFGKYDWSNDGLKMIEMNLKEVVADIK
jgi:hypothetical protein